MNLSEYSRAPEGAAAVGPQQEIFAAAERLFARNGLAKVTVRDITAEAGANLAAVSYYFRSKNQLLFEIFRQRSSELNRERARMLHQANDLHQGNPSVREILAALFSPVLRWYYADDRRSISIQFLLRARSEGTPEMRASLQKDVPHLERFAAALIAACPHLSEEAVYWRLHFSLGVVNNIRTADFERIHHVSQGRTADVDADWLLTQMIDYAEAGFKA